MVLLLLKKNSRVQWDHFIYAIFNGKVFILTILEYDRKIKTSKMGLLHTISREGEHSRPWGAHRVAPLGKCFFTMRAIIS